MTDAQLAEDIQWRLLAERAAASDEFGSGWHGIAKDFSTEPPPDFGTALASEVYESQWRSGELAGLQNFVVDTVQGFVDQTLFMAGISSPIDSLLGNGVAGAIAPIFSAARASVPTNTTGRVGYYSVYAVAFVASILITRGAAAAEETSALANASRAAFQAADRVGEFTVPLKHLPGSGGNWSSFAAGENPQALIEEALRSPAAQFLPNNRPDSYRVVYDFGRVIGEDGETAIRVIFGEGPVNGRVWTAFPQ
jgi:hypothetical protein